MEIMAELQSIKGVGPVLAKKFKAVGIETIADLLDYFPRKYNDYAEITPINKLKPGQVTIQAKIKQATGRYVRRGMHITEAVASDESGSVRLLWFNQPYRADGLKKDQAYYITGKLELRRQRFSITNPSVELVSDFPLHTARIVPVYRESKGITSSIIRRSLAQIIKAAGQLPEVLPASIIKKYDLLTYGQAIAELHFPSSRKRFSQARYTVGFIEIFELMLASQLNKQIIKAELAQPVKFNEKLAKKFVASLPFKLTNAQRRVAWQIFQDMQKNIPMGRLIEGDVGSGKTIVAGMAGLMVMEEGMQAALMAPTELLAKQHSETLSQLFASINKESAVGLLVGSMRPAQKKLAHERIKSGDIKFIVGTQALLQDKVSISRLGLLIVDEQHRFGVEQRKKLIATSGYMPHVLNMTATPIPRSLALTLYGELDISLLDEMPPGRMPIITRLISPNSRDKLYDHIRQEVKAGRQVYIVCPVIQDNSGIKAPSAEKLYEQLGKTTFKDLKLGLLHGKLKDRSKEDIMKKFLDKEIDILISTTVIEVGISVSNASIMVIEGADRFGLAQIHQLRGRVGRSNDQGYCYIVPTDSKPPSRRLRALEQSVNGFELAELDLEIRGPGAIYGTLQHGELDLRIAKLNDARLLASARAAVKDFIGQQISLKSYSELARRVRAAQAVVTLN